MIENLKKLLCSLAEVIQGTSFQQFLTGALFLAVFLTASSNASAEDLNKGLEEKEKSLVHHNNRLAKDLSKFSYGVNKFHEAVINDIKTAKNERREVYDALVRVVKDLKDAKERIAIVNQLVVDEIINLKSENSRLLQRLEALETKIEGAHNNTL